MEMVITGEGGFAVTPRGVMDLPESQLAALRQSARRNLLALLKARHEPGFTATALAPGELDGSPVERLEVATDGEVTVVGLDPETGRIRQLTYRSQGPGGGPGEVVETYSDWRDVGGLSYPFAMTGTFEGEEMQSLQLEDVEVGGEVDEKGFERPVEPEGGS
jgi:hypothetical protein